MEKRNPLWIKVLLTIFGTILVFTFMTIGVLCMIKGIYYPQGTRFAFVIISIWLFLFAFTGWFVMVDKIKSKNISFGLLASSLLATSITVVTATLSL